MENTQLQIKRFALPLTISENQIEAVCISCGDDLVVVIGGGSRYHIGTAALTVSMPSLKDPQKLTNSTWQMPVPGHKEEFLARESSLILSRELDKNVVVTVGIHEDDLGKEGIKEFVKSFDQLIEQIRESYFEK